MYCRHRVPCHLCPVDHGRDREAGWARGSDARSIYPCRQSRQVVSQKTSHRKPTHLKFRRKLPQLNQRANLFPQNELLTLEIQNPAPISTIHYNRINTAKSYRGGQYTLTFRISLTLFLFAILCLFPQPSRLYRPFPHRMRPKVLRHLRRFIPVILQPRVNIDSCCSSDVPSPAVRALRCTR
jgi:hypothetical protein